MYDSTEILSGNNFASRCDYIYAQTKDVGGSPSVVFADHFPTIKDHDVIFCKTDFIAMLTESVVKYVPVDVPFSVLTHDSDYTINDALIEGLVGNRPIRWYGMNMNSSKKMATPIPIGIANSYCNITMKSGDFEKSKNPSRLLYVNHRIETNPSVREWLYPFFTITKYATVKTPTNVSIIQYRNDILDHKFLLCPQGNGIDTHRMWEALYCGVIPIVMRHNTHSNLEGKLPILFVDDYREVTEDLLNATYEEYSNRQWNEEMLTVSWWMKHIKVGLR